MNPIRCAITLPAAASPATSVAPGGGTPEAFAAFVRADYEKWGRFGKESGVKVE